MASSQVLPARPWAAHAVLAGVVRSGVVESVHVGTAVALDPGGRPVVAAGDPGATLLARSALKPLQAVAMLRAGLSLDGALLALAASSHSGERFHLDGVRRMLASGALRTEALQNTPDLPLDEEERLAWRLAGRPATSLAQNCSGKHAAMLLTCRENGWPLDAYCGPGHPLQRHIAGTVAELSGEPVSAVAVDGCGAPALGVTASGLARAFARLAVAPPGTPEGRVADAVRRHPEWLGGTGRGVTRLLGAVPGLIAKDGAEAVFAAALPDGGAVAVKIGDGSTRPLLPVVVALLRRLGVGGEGLDELADVAVLGHGQRVGKIEVTQL
ncbi:MAG TPA: asparaginase [Kineosporiaceae bacterium]